MPIEKHTLSKTTFMYGCQCPKRLWLHKKKPSLKDERTEEQEQVFARGTNVGLLAQSLFPNGVDASPPNPWSYQQSVRDTAKYIRNGHHIIYEAAFQYNGILCAVDILIKTVKGWVAYEVKSSLSLKETHIDDAALQYYVLSNSELMMADFAVVHLNKNYTRQGELDLRKLFFPVSVIKKILPLQDEIASNAEVFQELLQSPTVPDIATGAQCFSPYPCDFLGHCHAGIFEMPVREVIIETQSIAYPAHFLEIEFSMDAVPQQDGHWPYKKNILWYKISHQEADDAAKMIILESEKFQNEDVDACALLLDTLQSASNIIVDDKKKYYYLLEDLKKVLSIKIDEIEAVQQKLQQN